MSSFERAQLALYAEDMALGTTAYLDCPWCGRKNKLGLTKTAGGLLYYCFSTHCGQKGSATYFGGYTGGRAVSGSNRSPRWTGIVHPPKLEDNRFFAEWFDISLKNPTHSSGWEIFLTESGDYLFPILDANGRRVGEVLRKPTWDGHPRRVYILDGKAKTYLDGGAVRLSWHCSTLTRTGGRSARCSTLIHPLDRVLYVVEDQISAERIRQSGPTGTNAVALLGCSMSDEQAEAIRRSVWSETKVVFWLDPDKSKEAFQMNARYGQLFPKSGVVWADEDPKDLPTGDLVRLLEQNSV